jgi:hypothetical protein
MQLFAAGLVTSSPSAQFDLARDSVTRLLRHDGTVARPLGDRWLSERLSRTPTTSFRTKSLPGCCGERHAARVAQTSSTWPRWLTIRNSPVSVLNVTTTRPEVTI